MRTDRILAVALIAASLAAAAGAWLAPARSSAAPALGLAGRGVALGPAEVAVFDIYGEISDGPPDGGLGGQSGVNSTRLIPLLRQAVRDGVKAIVLRVNSPGGTAAASAAIYDELMQIRKKHRIPIVASFGDVAASGAYYLSSAANRIVALPSTTTGSIGVIAHAMNLQGIMGKIGIRDIAFKSGPHKDILSPYRPIEPAERVIIQHIVDEVYQQFLVAVATGRSRQLPLAKLRPLADGRIYTGQDALKLGLVDQLGTFQDAVLDAAHLAGIKGEPTVKDYTRQTLIESIFKAASSWSGGIHVDLGPRLSHLDEVPLALME